MQVWCLWQVLAAELSQQLSERFSPQYIVGNKLSSALSRTDWLSVSVGSLSAATVRPWLTDCVLLLLLTSTYNNKHQCNSNAAVWHCHSCSHCGSHCSSYTALYHIIVWIFTQVIAGAESLANVADSVCVTKLPSLPVVYLQFVKVFFVNRLSA